MVLLAVTWWEAGGLSLTLFDSIPKSGHGI